MPEVPYAKLMMSIDGAPRVSGGQTIAGGNSIQLSGESTIDWRIVQWEIYQYPAGFTCPAGWSDVGGVFRSNVQTPPAFTIPAAATRWGKYLFRLVVNNGLLDGVYMGPGSNQPLVDELSGVKVLSPNLGLNGISAEEKNQFDVKSWIEEIKKDLVIIEAELGVVGPSLTATGADGTLATLNGVNAASGLTGSANLKRNTTDNEIEHLGSPRHKEGYSEFQDSVNGTTHGLARSYWKTSTTANATPVTHTTYTFSNATYGACHIALTVTMTVSADTGNGGVMVKTALFKRTGGTLTRIAISDQSTPSLLTAAVSFDIDVNDNDSIKIVVTGLPTDVNWNSSTHVQLTKTPA